MLTCFNVSFKRLSRLEIFSVPHYASCCAIETLEHAPYEISKIEAPLMNPSTHSSFLHLQSLKLVGHQTDNCFKDGHKLVLTGLIRLTNHILDLN